MPFEKSTLQILKDKPNRAYVNYKIYNIPCSIVHSRNPFISCWVWMFTLNGTVRHFVSTFCTYLQFQGQSELRKFSNARPIYSIYWFITTKTAPITGKWDHKMVQILEFLILETLAPPTTRPVQWEEKEGRSLCQRGDNKTKLFFKFIHT